MVDGQHTKAARTPRQVRRRLGPCYSLIDSICCHSERHFLGDAERR
jgi:hypothetical protein